MNKGFFTSSELVDKKAIPRTARCGLCGLYKHCKSPKMPPTGKGKKKILVIAEAPGEQEDKKNIQLIGKAGQRLRRSLKRLKIDLDRDCWKTNAVICRREENKTPDDYMIEYCRPNLIKTIEKYQPNVIILLGAVAVKSLLSYVWKEDVGAISRWGGYCIPCQNLNAWIVPTFHPSFIMRKNDRIYDKIFEKHLRLAIDKHKSKPWKKIPSYKNDIEIILRPSRAAKIIKHWIKERQDPVAFDYETNCLKPEIDKAEIVSCSISSGNNSIAYAWQAEAIEATDLLTKSKLPKIASNLKFEDRWTRAKLKHPVKNWLWDTMLAAHVIDNRPDITSIKFQSFVLLGMESYNEHIKSFLYSKRSNQLNRIHELNLKDLLLYNGLDSLAEYKVAMKQIKILERRNNEYNS